MVNVDYSKMINDVFDDISDIPIDLDRLGIRYKVIKIDDKEYVKIYKQTIPIGDSNVRRT
jgi:hypothetical protein